MSLGPLEQGKCHMARAKVGGQQGIQMCPFDKLHPPESHHEVLVGDDIMIPCPKSTIEVKNLETQFLKRKI